MNNHSNQSTTFQSRIGNLSRRIGLKNPVKKVQKRIYLALPKNKKKSAMIRIKNEEEFLYPSVKSIVEYMDEIVIIDNLSTDKTPEIINFLLQEYPNKIFAYKYPYAIAKMGSENWNLVKNPLNTFSPNILSNYYNWCLKKCTNPYVVKWDGDMIATEEFYKALALFDSSENTEIMHFKGLNIHPNLSCVISSRIDESKMKELNLSLKTFQNYLNSYTESEPRIFPKMFSRYVNTLWFCEQLYTPLIDSACNSLLIENECYFHTKYCKKDPWLNFSDEFKSIISEAIVEGEKIEFDMADSLKKWVNLNEKLLASFL